MKTTKAFEKNCLRIIKENKGLNLDQLALIAYNSALSSPDLKTCKLVLRKLLKGVC